MRLRLHLPRSSTQPARTAIARQSSPFMHGLWAAGTQQIGRARGSDIVREGPDPRGGVMRWSFTEILPDSFHWTAERAQDEKSWRREVDIRARRAAAYGSPSWSPSSNARRSATS